MKTGKNSSPERDHGREEELGWRDAGGSVVDTSESGWGRSLERIEADSVLEVETGSNRIGGPRQHWYTHT